MAEDDSSRMYKSRTGERSVEATGARRGPMDGKSKQSTASVSFTAYSHTVTVYCGTVTRI